MEKTVLKYVCMASYLLTRAPFFLILQFGRCLCNIISFDPQLSSERIREEIIIPILQLIK